MPQPSPIKITLIYLTISSSLHLCQKWGFQTSFYFQSPRRSFFKNVLEKQVSSKHNVDVSQIDHCVDAEKSKGTASVWGEGMLMPK